MAIEIAYLSLLVRRRAVESLDPPDRDVALKLLHWEPAWFREDAALLATAFMCPSDARAFGEALDARLQLARGEDWVVVDAATGPTEPVSWLAFEVVPGAGPVAWDPAGAPGPVAVIAAWLPGPVIRPRPGARVLKLFGRDSRHDPANRREAFGTLIPAWGGKDLWLAADPEDTGPEPGWVTVEAPVDFQTLGALGPLPSPTRGAL